MNVVKEINKINERELDLGGTASWHDDYKDSAYIFVGGLSFDLSEGDVITIFSQYGEILDINMPRDKETGKPRGFAFMMYEDQRSTVLAVDNLNGAKVLERTLRVDHVRDYKQPGSKDDKGDWVDAEEPSMNARPELIQDEDASGDSDSSEDLGADIDPDDPMREYLIQQRREERVASQSKPKKKKEKKSKKHPNETPEERRARKEAKRAKKAEKAGKKGKKSTAASGVEDLLKSLGVPDLARRSAKNDGEDSDHDNDEDEKPRRRRDSYSPDRRRHSRSRSPITRPQHDRRPR